MKAKLIITLMLSLFLASITAIAVPVKAEYGTPMIDGAISLGEWGAPTFSTSYFNIYMLNDEASLYVGFEALGGTFLPTGDGDVGMMNTYVFNMDSGEEWAYTWIHRTPALITLYHFDPDRHEDPTTATFSVTETVYELKIPLSELTPISLGDTVAVRFICYTQDWTDWNTCWYPPLGQPEDTYTLTLPPQIWFKASGGGVSYSDATQTSGDYCTLGVIGMSLESSTGVGDRVPCKGSGTFIDHDMKLKISFNIEEGAIVRADNLIYFWGTASVFDIYNHEKAYDVPFRLGLVDDEYGTTNRFDVQCYGYYWHGTLLPESEVTVWVWST